MKYFLVLLLINYINCQITTGLDDTILYKISWPGQNAVDLLELTNVRIEELTTKSQEKYKCIIPEIKDNQKDLDDEYNGPNPVDLLTPIFLQSSCTTVLESYWSYELCHGRHIRQYHEEREGKNTKIQEYYLGKWDPMMTAKLSEQFDKEYFKAKEEERKFQPPLKKLNGITLPFLQFNFTDGTLCDLNGKPRRTEVLYVCFAGGKNDMFIVKEISTCEYEVIVVSSELCKHPKYRPQINIEHEINCIPQGDSPTKPTSFVEMEEEMRKQSHFPSFEDKKSGQMFAVYSIDEIKDKEGNTQVRVELRPVDTEVEPELPSAMENESPADTPWQPVQPDSVPSSLPFEVEEFLAGLACPQGGYGWWKYKFCYGKYVEQFHDSKYEKGITRRLVTLGTWNKEDHLNWISKRPHKRPKPISTRTSISHYYGNGEPCHETGKPREVEVKLKCNSKKGTVSIYLLEPNVCQYILVIESPLICQFLNKVDENGLINL